MLHVVRRHRAFADGFPKAGPVPYEKKQLAAKQVAVAYGHRIELVVCFGALWYVLNGAGAPVLADKAALPGRVDTKGADFDMMGTATSTSFWTILTVLNWICGGIHGRGVLHSLVLALDWPIWW